MANQAMPHHQIPTNSFLKPTPNKIHNFNNLYSFSMRVLIILCLLTVSILSEPETADSSFLQDIPKSNEQTIFFEHFNDGSVFDRWSWIQSEKYTGSFK